MKLSFLQLNINADNYWGKLIPFIKANNFDILHLQEITGKGTKGGNINSKVDVFEELQKVLADTYRGELAIAEHFDSSPTAYLGNAIFYKKDFSLEEKQIVNLYKRETPFPSESVSFEDEGRAALILKLRINDKDISFINAHGAWAKSPTEELHQTKQGEILVNYLKQVQRPFVFSADMNLSPQQPLIQKINTLGENLTETYNVTNTLNPRIHRARHLFPAGVTVDYIWISEGLKVNTFSVVEEDFSDHFGLRAEFEI